MVNLQRYLDKKYRFWHLLLIFFVILRLPSLFEPYWYGDEGIYLTLGLAIRKGLVLYRDIHDNKPPLLYFFAAFSQTVFGFRLFLALWLLPTYYLFYHLSLRLLRHQSAAKLATAVFFLFSSIPLIEGNIANSEIFMLLPTIAGVYFFYTATKLHHYLLAAFCLGVSLCFKMPVGVEFAFLLFWVFTTKRKIIAPVISISFFFLPLFLFGIYYSTKGVLLNFLSASLLQNFGYLSSWATGSHSGSATQSGLLLRSLILLLSWLFFYFLHTRRSLKPLYYFLLLWFSATLYAVLLSERPYPHYLILLLPSFSLLFGLLLALPRPSTYFLVAGCYLCLLFSLAKYKFYFYPNLSYYSNFYSYLVRLKTPFAYRHFFAPKTNQTMSIATLISQTDLNSDHLFVWGDEPYLYPLTNKLPVGRYTVAYHIVDFNGYSETIDRLKIHLPTYVVYYHQPTRPFPALDQFLQRYYTIYQQIGDAIIFRLRS